MQKVNLYSSLNEQQQKGKKPIMNDITLHLDLTSDSY